MFAARFFRSSSVSSGEALFASALAQARRPGFYRRPGVPDTAAGRFEFCTLHVALLVLRLKGREGAQRTVQALFDAYLENMDIALREIGVGDPSMARKMRKLAEVFYDRAHLWETALSDRDGAGTLVSQTLLSDSRADPEPLAGYVLEAAAHLERQADERLLAGEVFWPEAPQ